MKRLFTILLLLAAATAMAQDSLRCAGKKIAIVPGNRHHEVYFLHCYDKPVDSAAVPAFIWQAANTYLQTRTDTAKTRLHYRRAQTIVCERFNKEQIKQGLDTVNLYQRTKYALEYDFTLPNNLRYVFSLLFNYTGEMIIPHQLPLTGSSHSYNTFSDACKAVDLAEQDTDFKGPVRSISLEYLQDEHVFVWKLEKPVFYTSNDKSEGQYRFLLIDAHTGKLIKRETSTWHTAIAPPPEQ